MKTFNYTTDYITNHQEGLNHITSFSANTFVHKTHTGMGGTTAFLECDKNILIISPNTGMVQKKSESNADDAIYIYNAANGKWSEALKKVKNGETTKINSTWKSLQTLSKNTSLFKEVTEHFHLVVDEVHCIYHGIEEEKKPTYKRKSAKVEPLELTIPQIMDKFKNNWVATTATPIMFDATTISDNIDYVTFKSTKPKEDLTIIVASAEDKDVSDIFSYKVGQTGTMVASNNNRYTILYTGKHQVLASEQFQLKSNPNNALQITGLVEVDPTCDYVQYTKRYDTGFDIFGSWHSLVVAECDLTRDVNVDARTHQQIRQSIGRLRDTPLTTTILWRSKGTHRPLKQIEADIHLNPTKELIEEYALAETFGDLDYFVEIMESYGYNVTVERMNNVNSIKKVNLLKSVNNILENGQVNQNTTKAFKYIAGDNRDNFGLPPTVVIAHIIATLITDGVITLDEIKLIGDQPRRIYEGILLKLDGQDKYEMFSDFIRIHLFNNRIKTITTNACSTEFTSEKKRIDIYTRAYAQVNANLLKHANGYSVKDIAKLHFNASKITKNVKEKAEYICENDEDQAICDKLVRRITAKVKKIIRENGTINDLIRAMYYDPRQIIGRWVADNTFLFCKKYELPVNHFRISKTGHREYNPITKSETWTRYLLPIETNEYDIKEAYPTFIDKILGVNTGSGIYDRIMRIKELERPEAKVYFNKLINNHYDDINSIKANLKEIGYPKNSVKWLAPRIKRNEMFEILSEYEKKVVEEFAMLHGAPFARLHDAIVTYTKVDIRVKEHFESKGIRFGGDFTQDSAGSTHKELESIDNYNSDPTFISRRLIKKAEPIFYRHSIKKVEVVYTTPGAGPHLDRSLHYPPLLNAA